MTKVPKVGRKNEEKDQLIDLLFSTNLSIAEIAKTLCIQRADLDKLLNRHGLSWVKDHRKKMSKGQGILTSVFKKLFPGEKIINEYHIGERLKLDVYCPKYKICAEFHGIQHFQYTERFFDSREDFLLAQERDKRKLELCKDNGIAVVVFRYNDSLSEESVYARILDAIKSAPPAAKKVVLQNKKNVEYYKKAKKYNSEKRKSYYKKVKEEKKNGKNHR